MPLKFTTRKPVPKASAVDPLKEPAKEPVKKAGKTKELQKELGGPSGPEPTRYGDWERKGICVDF
jgi:hypothetical protein